VWQVAFVYNQEEDKGKAFENIKRLCDAMGAPEKKKEYMSRMKPPTRKSDTRGATARTNTAAN